jgi:ubiquitin carboxyl-terminal hydrolase 1
MYLSEELHFYLLQLARNPLLQQLAPFAVFFLVPLFIFLFTAQAATYKNQLLWSAAMVLESLGLGLPWNWSGNNVHASGSGTHERKKSKKKHTRTRAEQANTDERARRGMYFDYIQSCIHSLKCTESSSPLKGSGVEDGYYPGLVNISGTYCFMNSTLQVCAGSFWNILHSLTYH